MNSRGNLFQIKIAWNKNKKPKPKRELKINNIVLLDKCICSRSRDSHLRRYNYESDLVKLMQQSAQKNE